MGVNPGSRNFDARGMTVGRMLRQHLFGKVRPLWCFSNGLEFKHLLALGVRVYLGRPIAYLTTRYEAQWRKLLAGWRRASTGVRGRSENDRPAP